MITGPRTPSGLAAAPSAALDPGSGAAGHRRGIAAPSPPGGWSRPAGSDPAYTIEQAISDRAQSNTIAFDALGFLTGTLELRLVLPAWQGRRLLGLPVPPRQRPERRWATTPTSSPGRPSTCSTLTPRSASSSSTLAKSQVGPINDYGYKRFVLMKAFRRLARGRPAGRDHRPRARRRSRPTRPSSTRSTGRSA